MVSSPIITCLCPYNFNISSLYFYFCPACVVVGTELTCSLNETIREWRGHTWAQSSNVTFMSGIIYFIGLHCLSVPNELRVPLGKCARRLDRHAGWVGRDGRLDKEGCHSVVSSISRHVWQTLRSGGKCDRPGSCCLDDPARTALAVDRSMLCTPARGTFICHRVMCADC